MTCCRPDITIGEMEAYNGIALKMSELKKSNKLK